MEENPFMEASPDSNVDCSCCGSGLLEVKCPNSIKREKPSHENDNVTLKQNHPFFYHVQRQMGVTGKNHCGLLFIHTLELVRKELHWIQKSGKIFFKHCNSFGTNIYHLKFYYKNFKHLPKALLYMIKPKLSLINQKYISQRMTLPLYLFQTF